MRNLGRFYPPDREVLKDVTLAFIPGAKIGVLGHNGAGKSSVLKIMAGIDDGFTGEARLSPGFSVGLLEQEPGLDEDKNVIENIMEGVAETQSFRMRILINGPEWNPWQVNFIIDRGSNAPPDKGRDHGVGSWTRSAGKDVRDRLEHDRIGIAWLEKSLHRRNPCTSRACISQLW